LTVTILEDAEAQVSEVSRSRRTSAPALASLPWLIVLAVLVAAWWTTDVDVTDIAGYLAYWLLCLLLPGTLVHRALRGSRGNLPEDLGYGAATGLLLELGAWALVAALGQQHMLRWWPVPVVLLFLVVPRLRRHWRVSGHSPLPLGWHWAMCAVLILIINWAAVQWPDMRIPPADYPLYQDFYYHLALVHELTRAMPFELPQMVGEPLRYHYLSDAHMASASMITGSSPVVVLLRLFIVPVAATAAVVTAGLARDLTGRWWAGPLGAGVAYLGVPVALGSAMVDSSNPLLTASPSQTYMLPLYVVLAGLCVQVVRGQPLGPGWALVPAFGIACGGAKLSTLPPLVCGLLLAGAASGWLHRRVPWAIVAALGCLVAAMAVGYALFSGAGASTLKLQAFALLRFQVGPAYAETLGVDDGVQVGGLVPPGLAAADAAGWLFALGIVAWWLMMQAPRFVGMLILTSKEGRTDPAAWLLSGVVLSGVAATWAFYHPSAAQYYFWRAVLLFGALLGVWLLVTAQPPWQVPAASGLAGVIACLTVPPMVRPAATQDSWAAALVASAGRLFAFVVGAALLGVGLAAVLRRRSTGRVRMGGGRRAAAMAAVAVTAALLGASVAENVSNYVERGIAGRYEALLFDRPLPRRPAKRGSCFRERRWSPRSGWTRTPPTTTSSPRTCIVRGRPLTPAATREPSG
jgi:hypothetical protein